jgi:RNA ligase (TIGR02306 family)
MVNMDRKLASIQIINDLQPIPGADAILKATVLGWECVVKKDEFKVGDECVYFEIDSILPVADWNAHLRKGSDAHKPLRVKTIRLRGQLSQGLALPTTLIKEEIHLCVGMDVTELVGVKKYEPYIPAELHGKVKGTRPSWIPKTDEIRLQSVPDALTELLALNTEVVGTHKMDGSSVTCYIKDGIFGVTSRNMDLLETEDNAFWKTIRRLKVEEKMRAHLPVGGGNYAIQGELIGPGIQGNRMSATELDIHWYNLFHIDTGTYFSTKMLWDFTISSGLTMVQIHFMGRLPVGTSVGSLLEMANGLNYSNGLPAEGLVWRPFHEAKSEVLKGRMSFKTISNRFLEKYKE